MLEGIAYIMWMDYADDDDDDDNDDGIVVRDDGDELSRRRLDWIGLKCDALIDMQVCMGKDRIALFGEFKGEPESRTKRSSRMYV